ncbi:MAG TPA: hypothetical protein VF175_01010 [Lacipirellula sp.]
MPFLPRNRTLCWSLIIAGTVGVLLVGASLWALYSSNSFASRIAAIRAAGDPASIADLTPPSIPKEDDAAAHLAAIKPQLDAFSRDYVWFLERTPLGKEYEAAVNAGERPTPEQTEAIRDILAKYGDVDAAINKAAACDQYASKLDFSLPHQQFIAAALDAWSNLRTVTRFMVWQIEVAVADGKHDESVDKGVQILRLAQLHNAEPCLAASLIGSAVRGLAAQKVYEALSVGPISAKTRQQLEAELACFEKEPGYLHTLKSERALTISAVQANFGGIRGLLVGWPRPVSANLLDYYEQVLPLPRMSWHEVQTTPSAKQALSNGPGGLASLMLPAMQAWFEAANRTNAIMRSLRVCNALQTPAETSPGQPASIDALGLPKEATIDPFSGDPLIIKKRGDDWAVYSVGKDGKDDGGDIHGGKDYGVGPRGSD